MMVSTHSSRAKNIYAVKIDVSKYYFNELLALITQPPVVSFSGSSNRFIIIKYKSFHVFSAPLLENEQSKDFLPLVRLGALKSDVNAIKSNFSKRFEKLEMQQKLKNAFLKMTYIGTGCPTPRGIKNYYSHANKLLFA